MVKYRHSGVGLSDPLWLGLDARSYWVRIGFDLSFFRSLRRWGFRGLGILLVLALIGLGGGLLWLRSSLPKTAGTLNLPGLGAEVEIRRNPQGLVTIRAQSETDASFALGFVHAQDRLWQMDLMRRAGAGRLSEIFGSATLGIDKLMRLMDFYRLAKATYGQLSPPAQALLDAYSLGVNAFLEQRRGALPLEFQLLRYAPEPWRPADSLVWGKAMALELSDNWRAESLRARLAARLSEAQIDFLWPAYPQDAPVTLAERVDPALLLDLASILPWSLMPKSASNVWVLSGAKTASGKPLLANDPHLALETPSVWYLARIETPSLTLTGATAPGVPFHILGHNGRIAWGFTTTHSDTQDLFIEQAADRPGYYRSPDGDKPLKTRKEMIEVKGEEAVEVTFRYSRHGPIISDLRGPAPGKDQMLALAWPALRDDDATPQALYELNRAGTWREALVALENFHSPQQNVMVADTAGSIGMVAAGRVPLRPQGDGRRPVPGWEGAYDWLGFLPFQELPQGQNPPDGRFVNANNRIVDTDYPHLITAYWQRPHRAQRINDLLDQLGPAQAIDMRAIQQDSLSLAAQRLLSALLPLIQDAPDPAPEVTAMLAGWDGTMRRDDAAPLVFHAWVRALNQALIADELGPDFPAFQRPTADLLHAILTKGQAWCDDVATLPPESCQEKVVEALSAAWQSLEQRFGDDPGEWRWGAAHVARFPHPLLSRVPILDKLFETSVETDGGHYTINRGGPRFGGDEGHRFEHIHGAGYRAVYDLADLDKSLFIMVPGQSGNPLSRHYSDLAEAWRDGAYLGWPIGGKQEADRLLLTPPADKN